MRIGSVSLLVLAAFALAACSGAETGGSTLAASSLNGLDIEPCTLETCPPNPDSNPNPINDADGDGIDDGADGNDSSTDGGNTTNLQAATSDVTIALETSRLVRPRSGTSLSLLTAGTSPATTTAQILSGTKPTQMTIRIDTNSSTNGNWPTPIQMPEYVPGTTRVDPTHPSPDPFENGGATSNYREYRIYSEQVGQERDETLQVWAWTDSYATQYRNTPGGGEAANAAWSFGGNRTAVMPTTATPTTTYNGRFVATAKTSNWKKPSGADINPNALWRVQGASTLTANWGTASVTGTLSPETWLSDQDSISAEYTQVVGGPPMAPFTIVQAPYYDFYDATVTLQGTITGNTYAGSANLNSPYLNGDQTMYGGFFGAGASETTGVFHVSGADPNPLGGSAGINNDTRGFLNIQGAFNADCTVACPP
jgi:hypothetical protein